MSHLTKLAAWAVLGLLIPLSAWADLSGTATVPANSMLNLGTGAVAASGGDILFTGTTIIAQGKAGTYDNGTIYLGGFNIIGLTTLQALQPVLTQDPETPVVGDVIAVYTNGGLYSKVLVTAISTSSITLQYYTYGAASTPAGPAISAIQNNYSYIQAGLPNYGIAPGTIFIVTGTDLANAGPAVLQSSAAPGIPTTLNGASISVTVGGVTTHPGMYYAIPTQIAAVLPSSTPVGTGTLTVTYNGVPSSAEPIVVVPTALGLDTLYGSGTGLAVATDGAGSVFSYSSSATPGETIVLWGSGLGADTADSDTVYTSSPHAINVPLQIYIGGILAKIPYQGASGYPGLNQIDVTIPSSVAPGCGVSIIAVSGSVVSNMVTVPVSAGGGACLDPALGETGQITGNGSVYRFGSLGIVQATGLGKTTSTAGGSFLKETITAATVGGQLKSMGNCYEAQSIIMGAGVNTDETALDAGTITVTGPAGTEPVPALAAQPGTYDAVLPAGFVTAAGGSFTFTGTGGADVGPFTLTLDYSNPFTWTNMAAITSVTRSQGVTVTWTGGDTPGYVGVSGTSTAPANANGANGVVAAGFFCYAPVSAGQLAVPPYILLGMPAGTGSLTVEIVTLPVTFNATGLDYGSGFVSYYTTILPPFV